MEKPSRYHFNQVIKTISIMGHIETGYYLAINWCVCVYVCVCVCVCVCVVSCVHSLWPHGLQPARLLCPRDFSQQEYWTGLPFLPPVLVAPVVKNLPAGDARDMGSIPGSGRSPGEGNGNPLQYPSLEKSQGQRSLAGCSPWGRKDWTWLSTQVQASSVTW